MIELGRENLDGNDMEMEMMLSMLSMLSVLHFAKAAH